MVEPKHISKRLKYNTHLSEVEVNDFQNIITKHPYFIPAHYILSSTQECKNIYKGDNWIYNDYTSSKTTPNNQSEKENDDSDVHTDIENEANDIKKDSIIPPLYTEDYFLHEGVEVSSELPEDIPSSIEATEDDEKSLMVVMSFTEWLSYYKKKKQKEKEEEQDQKALKSMWQRQKLAAAIEEENDEIPEDVFEMAVNSISKEEGLVSEALAQVHVKQGHYNKAIDIYKKLSLRNPQKKAYFARRIEEILKEK